jgi:hypothetical protein
MNTLNYTKLSTDDLIQRFVDEANQVGTIVRLERVKVPLDSPEWERANVTMNAIATELMRRDTVAVVRTQLFENSSPDVRGWAGTKWTDVDPLWAMAAFTGVLKKMTTKEVLAWRDRVLRDPPKRPTLKEMTIPQLLERFIDGCERLYGSTRFLMDEDGNNVSMKAYNRVAGQPYGVAKELYSRGKLDALVPLLDHPFITVRQRAASYCLDIAEDKALAVLKSIPNNWMLQESNDAHTVLSLRDAGLYHPFS